AQRSAQAAKETTAKIEGAIRNTTQGVALTQKVSSTLNEITGKARQLDSLATEVATASREQTAGITQVSNAVSQMGMVSQSNAAVAEQSASAAQELSAQATEMKKTLAQLLTLVAGNHAALPVVAAPPATPTKVSVPTRTSRVAQASSAQHGINGHGPDRSSIPMDGDFENF
ncbi:MAG TPA: chemotaxis protein, partial [Verrucomicrobiae bacterium]